MELLPDIVTAVVCSLLVVAAYAVGRARGYVNGHEHGYNLAKMRYPADDDGASGD